MKVNNQFKNRTLQLWYSLNEDIDKSIKITWTYLYPKTNIEEALAISCSPVFGPVFPLDSLFLFSKDSENAFLRKKRKFYKKFKHALKTFQKFYKRQTFSVNFSFYLKEDIIKAAVHDITLDQFNKICEGLITETPHSISQSSLLSQYFG